MPKLQIGTAVAVAAAVMSAVPAAAHDHAAQRGRLVFADHDAPTVGVVDLDSYEVTHRLDMPRPNPVLTTAQDGRHVVVKTGDEAGTVRILDTGVTFDSHGDHHDLEKGEVRLLDLAFTGVRPGHVLSAHGRLAIFFDGDRPWEGDARARVAFVSLSSLASATPEVATWNGPAPQHGIAVPLGDDRWLLSVAKEAYARGDDRTVSSRPDGFRVVASAGQWREVAAFHDTADRDASCKEFHGHAELGGVHAFGCNQAMDGDERGDGGVLLIAPRDGGWSARKLDYPDGRRSSTIKAGDGGRYMVANYGLKAPYDAFLRIDPAAERLSAQDVMPVPGGQATCHYEFTPDGRRMLNLTADGTLRVYEVEPDWKEVAAFEAIVPPFDCAFGAPTPTPALAVVGGSAFVSDPANGRIREIHIGALQQGLDIPVGGRPTRLAAGNHPR